MNNEIQEILIEEIKRLHRMNGYLEENMKNEPERIVENVLAMCDIAKLFNLNGF